MSDSGLDKVRMRTEAEARAEGHTPTPWSLYGADPLVIVDKDGASLGEMVPGDPYTSAAAARRNAAMVVLAVNSHDTLKAALTAALPLIEQEAEQREHSGNGEYFQPMKDLAEQVRAAGTKVTMLAPVADDLRAIGVNMMDSRRRELVLETSLRTSAASLRDGSEPLNLASVG